MNMHQQDAETLQMTANSLQAIPAASVLIVDDNPAKLQALVAVIAGMGLAVTTAPSGHEALRLLLKQDFALILLDVKMPVMDGFETA